MDRLAYCLPPSYSQTYWLGLRTTLNSHPNFDWVDGTIPAIPLVLAPPPPPPDVDTPQEPVLSPDTYYNWGTLQAVNASNTSEVLTYPEPNNFAMPPELCGAANYTQVTNGTWPWTDVNCGLQMPFMCRQTREWHSWLAPAMLLLICPGAWHQTLQKCKHQ